MYLDKIIKIYYYKIYLEIEFDTSSPLSAQNLVL